MNELEFGDMCGAGEAYCPYIKLSPNGPECLALFLGRLSGGDTNFVKLEPVGESAKRSEKCRTSNFKVFIEYDGLPNYGKGGNPSTFVANWNPWAGEGWLVSDDE